MPCKLAAELRNYFQTRDVHISRAEIARWNNRIVPRLPAAWPRLRMEPLCGTLCMSSRKSHSADDICLVLHYSGYGYHASGAPYWLADALERKPSAFASCRVIAFFHELYATGWPWQRACWWSSRQRAVAIRIARYSDELVTNRAQSARWLEQQTGRDDGRVTHLPICSNVGEPEELAPWEVRAPKAVLFGGAKFKESFLKRHAKCRQLKSANTSVSYALIDIGTPAALITVHSSEPRLPSSKQAGFPRRLFLSSYLILGLRLSTTFQIISPNRAFLPLWQPMGRCRLCCVTSREKQMDSMLGSIALVYPL